MGKVVSKTGLTKKTDLSDMQVVLITISWRDINQGNLKKKGGEREWKGLKD